MEDYLLVKVFLKVQLVQSCTASRNSIEGINEREN